MLPILPIIYIPIVSNYLFRGIEVTSCDVQGSLLVLCYVVIPGFVQETLFDIGIKSASSYAGQTP